MIVSLLFIIFEARLGLIAFAFPVQYVLMTGQILNKAQIPAYLGMIYGMGFEKMHPVGPIRTLDKNTAWSLVMAEWKDATNLPRDIGPFHPYFHYVKVGPDGKFIRIAQVLNSIDSYKNTAKLLEYGAKKAQEAAKVGTGA